MKARKTYEAEDGTVFDTRREALAHEEMAKVVQRLSNCGVDDEDVFRALKGQYDALADALLDAAKIVRASRKGGM